MDVTSTQESNFLNFQYQEIKDAPCNISLNFEICYDTILNFTNIIVRIIIWNSFCNKYTERSEAFSSLLAKVFFKNWEAFLVFCNVIFSISNTSFDNTMQWMNKIWISFGYNVEKFNVDQLNFLWEKTASHFSHDSQHYNCNN